MEAVDAPITAEQTKVTNLQSLNTVYDTVETDLSALDSAATAMTNVVTQPLSARTVSSSDSSVVTATATSAAALGTHSIAVSQLAKQDTLVSNQYSDSGTAIVDAEGAGTKSFTITVNGQSQDVSVSLTAGETDSAVISAVASAINSAYASVTSGDTVNATDLADTSSTSKLVLESGQTGATYAMTLSDDQNGGTLRSTVSAAVSDTGSSAVQTLADIGITQASDGTLSIDTDTFNQALSSNPSAVAALFNSTNGFANQVNAVLTPFTQTSGIMTAEKNNVTSQVSTLNATIKQMDAAANETETQYINEYSELQAFQSTATEQQSYMTTVLSLIADGTIS